MIGNIGVDIEDIERFSKLDKKRDSTFLRKVYTEKELKYCFSKSKPGQHLAARFCAKEAVIKVFKSAGKKIDIKQIELLTSKTGAPRVKIHKKEFSRVQVMISLSHCSDKAIAFAICFM